MAYGSDDAGPDGDQADKRKRTRGENERGAKGERPSGSKTEDHEDEDEDEDGDADGDDQEPPPKKGLLQRPILLASIGGVLVLAIIGGLLFWLNARNYQSTDDAFIDAHIVRLAPQISGRVSRIMVQDNQLVGVNQPLVRIDSADVQTRVAQSEAQKAQAQAEVDNARAEIAVNQANYQQALAQAAAAGVQAANAARDLTRYTTLEAINPAAVSPQQLDQARTTARQTAAQRDAALKEAKARAAQIKASETQVASGEDQVRAAQAVLNEANLNLGYAQIAAPITGHVAQKTVALGDYVSPGTQLLAIVPLNLWVTANFKETQLADIRINQKVSIHVDACPKAKVDGHIQSIEHGAGQAFAILPPENATGNFVKVVQRVPVKILIDHADKTCFLGPGMSVEPTVRVR
jgi:membrane fusion protein (multidrug efflux system)